MMRRFLLFALAVAMFAWPPTARATNQVHDHVRYEGVDGFMMECPLNPHFWRMPDQPEFEWITTANWKGYVAGWEIKDGALYLDSFEGKQKGKMVGPEVIFPGRKLPVLADWYSGRLRIATGETIYPPHWRTIHDLIFERVAFLQIEKGKVIRSVEFKNFRIKSDAEELEIERARHGVWPFPRLEHETLFVGGVPERGTLAMAIVPPEVIRRTPAWTDGDPPFSPLKAMLRAEAKSREFLPKTGKYSWTLSNVEIKKAFEDRYYYKCSFDPTPDVGTRNYRPSLRLAVLMDGSIPDPIRWFGGDFGWAQEAGFTITNDPPGSPPSTRWGDASDGLPWAMLPWHCRMSLVGSIFTAPKFHYDVEKVRVFSDGVWAEFALTNVSRERFAVAESNLIIPLRNMALWDSAGERWKVPHLRPIPPAPEDDKSIALEPRQTVRCRARISDAMVGSLEPFGLVEGRPWTQPAALEYFTSAWPPASVRQTDSKDRDVQVFAFGYGRVSVEWSNKPYPPDWPTWSTLIEPRVVR